MNYIKTIWPFEKATPWFRTNAENSKKLEEVVQLLCDDDSYTFPAAGLGKKAIEEIIRKHMKERRRKERDPTSTTGSDEQSDSSTASKSSPSEVAAKQKQRTYDAYFTTGRILSTKCYS